MINSNDAEEVCQQLIREYLEAAMPMDGDDVANLLEKMISVAASKIVECNGHGSALDVLGRTAAHVDAHYERNNRLSRITVIPSVFN